MLIRSDYYSERGALESVVAFTMVTWETNERPTYCWSPISYFLSSSTASIGWDATCTIAAIPLFRIPSSPPKKGPKGWLIFGGIFSPHRRMLGQLLPFPSFCLF